MAESKSCIDAKNMEAWNKHVSTSVDDQATIFLRAYALEFQTSGGFEEVLDIASQFKKYSGTGPDLEADRAHLFLEKRGETHTVKELSDKLKLIDVDKNHRMAFLEYCLFKWDKSVSNFFAELANPKKGYAELERAIAAYREVLAKKEAREAKMAELEQVAALGGVKGMAAKNQLAQMKSEDQLAQNKAQIMAEANKRKAEKNATDPFVEEQKRLEAEKKKKEEEEAKKKEESRQRLKDKAALWDAKK